jgi:uncharacterized protein with GYD domain
MVGQETCAGFQCNRRTKEAYMTTYIILGRFSIQLFEEPKEFKVLTDELMLKVKKECPSIVWKHSYATLGHYDVVDIVESDDPRLVEKTVMLMRAYGYSTAEVLSTTQWQDFVSVLE